MQVAVDRERISNKLQHETRPGNTAEQQRLGSEMSMNGYCIVSLLNEFPMPFIFLTWHRWWRYSSVRTDGGSGVWDDGRATTQDKPTAWWDKVVQRHSFVVFGPNFCVHVKRCYAKLFSNEFFCSKFLLIFEPIPCRLRHLGWHFAGSFETPTISPNRCIQAQSPHPTPALGSSTFPKFLTGNEGNCLQQKHKVPTMA